jgi:hypothetical protein
VSTISERLAEGDELAYENAHGAKGVIYVLRAVGTANSNFTINIE